VNSVVAVTTGDTHACALADDGRVFCWGQNDEGQLGDGTTDYRDFGTVPVVGIDDARTIAAGIRFSCAVRADGTVWCWGEDPGQDPSTLLPRRVAGINDAQFVTAGGAFACALRETHQVVCWGNNALGQLGTGSFSAGEATAQPVEGLSDAVEVNAGWNHACAIRFDRTLWCWGGNGDGATGYGQLGDGTLQNRASPVQVSLPADVISVAAGGWTTCATLVDDTVWCWGYGERGTLGDGNFSNSSVPVQVVGLDNVGLLALGDYTACASRDDDSVWCWGDTSWGSSTGGPAGTPVEGNKSSSIAVGALANDRYCLFIDGREQVWWWGTGTNQAPERWPVGP
jgi:alpha-tubulin suppressor-like RCC1 family protein